jgi:hypothetical protein
VQRYLDQLMRTAKLSTQILPGVNVNVVLVWEAGGAAVEVRRPNQAGDDTDSAWVQRPAGLAEVVGWSP